MINAHAFSGPTTDAGSGSVFLITRNIAAIQIEPAQGSGRNRLGMITQLPAGSELRICGEGFNERTVKVAWAEHFYFVFLQDLEPAQVLTATA